MQTKSNGHFTAAAETAQGTVEALDPRVAQSRALTSPTPPEGLWRVTAPSPYPKLHVLSDLHLETGPYELPEGLEYDILIAAGDIGPVEIAVPWLAKQGKPVVYVLGNHERYDSTMLGAVTRAKELAQGTPVTVLEHESVVIQGVRFLGATLWTSFGELHPNLVSHAERFMNDYGCIQGAADWLADPEREARFRELCEKLQWPGNGTDDRLHPLMTYVEHERTLAWLDTALKEGFDGATVIVTHHAPTYKSLRAYGLAERYFDPANWNLRKETQLTKVAAYASALDHKLKAWREDVDLWCHGHIHAHLDLVAEGIRVLANPRGRYQAPLTTDSAKAYQLFGVSFSEEDIARSQARHAADPYGGSSPGFEPSFLVNLEEGLRRPLQRALTEPLQELEALVADTKALLAHVMDPPGVPRDCVRRCFDHNCTSARAVIEGVQQEWARAIDEHATSSVLSRCHMPINLPHAPWDEGIDGKPPRLEDYVDVHAEMSKWCQWVRELPYVVSWGVHRWAELQTRAIALMKEKGFEAAAQRLSPQALRLAKAQRLNLIVTTSAGEEVPDEIYEWLDESFNEGGPPREVCFNVWGLEEGDAPRYCLREIPELPKRPAMEDGRTEPSRYWERYRSTGAVDKDSTELEF